MKFRLAMVLLIGAFAAGCGGNDNGSSAEPTTSTLARWEKLLEAYREELKATGTTIVERASVRIESGPLRQYYLTLTVKNIWHLRHRQVRLQDTQALWTAWAVMASPEELDRARISIEDLSGNEVGGSRVLGGSLIWVQD